MGSAMVHFRSPRQPAHYVRAGRGYKFVGGRLAVRAEDAEWLRAYALANPALGIVEEPTRPRAPRRPKGDAGAAEGEA
jgi:hypothetical protein